MSGKLENVGVRDGTKGSKPAVEKAQPSAEAIARRNRRTKSPISGRRNILTVKGLAPGMVGRWIDNTPERVEQLMERGYEPVREKVQIGDVAIDQGQPMGNVVTKRVGGGKECILMQIPEDWYKADQAEKHKLVEEREKALHEKAQDQYGSIETVDIVPGKRPTSRTTTDET